MVRGAVLFDFDCTLADSAPAIVDCVEHAFLKMGLPPPARHEICRTIGLPLPDTFRALSPHSAQSDEREFIRLFAQRGDEVIVRRTSLYPEAKLALDSLVRMQFALGIVSAKFHSRIEAILIREGCRNNISVIIGSEDVTQPKPSPAGILKALQHINCPDQRSFYVGDSLFDAQAAASAGVYFIAVTTGATQPTEFVAARPLAVLRTLAGLPDVLRKYALYPRHS